MISVIGTGGSKTIYTLLILKDIARQWFPKMITYSIQQCVDVSLPMLPSLLLLINSITLANLVSKNGVVFVLACISLIMS